MKLFNLDLHATVIKDLMDIFEGLGHSVDHWSISSHSWVHGWEKKEVDVVNQYTWKHLNETMCRRFYQRYRDTLCMYDAFVVTHTPAFALLYRDFNKPIIVVASTRYEAPFTMSKRKWEWLNNGLSELSSQHLLCRVANNKYDQQYCEKFTNISWTHIPSYCDHASTPWRPVGRRFLVDSKHALLPLRNVNTVLKKALGRFKWADMSTYAGVIVIPYNVSVMTVFEYYTACIPLFFPSKEFCMELYTRFPHLGIFSEISWMQIAGIQGPTALPISPNDPNNYQKADVVAQWINNCDWFDATWMPHITYFNSFPDLEAKLRTADLEDISKKMYTHNIIRKQKIAQLWSQQLNNLMAQNGR
ncbi:hypothetical protein [Chitinophaga eiseniae]|uniref:Uncharacterized protein n=1 Tax=Chitinophaga eiseniae TaxID=634771 RepID=A0A847SDE9_9BACT|nr:hypothetical protein [Chitinophaga eiseniae]NLR78204.1 hypothetical protein [Chitinophaga eiseniae]